MIETTIIRGEFLAIAISEEIVAARAVAIDRPTSRIHNELLDIILRE
jgi:hypothetical protein